MKKFFGDLFSYIQLEILYLIPILIASILNSYSYVLLYLPGNSAIFSLIKIAIIVIESIALLIFDMKAVFGKISEIGEEEEGLLSGVLFLIWVCIAIAFVIFYFACGFYPPVALKIGTFIPKKIMDIMMIVAFILALSMSYYYMVYMVDLDDYDSDSYGSDYSLDSSDSSDSLDDDDFEFGNVPDTYDILQREKEERDERIRSEWNNRNGSLNSDATYFKGPDGEWYKISRDGTQYQDKKGNWHSISDLYD